MRTSSILSLVSTMLATATLGLSQQRGDGYPEGIKNTEDAKNVPLPPQEALRRLAVPSGFKATLFAGEPDVAQPISIAFDDRGRLWVAECYSFESAGGPWNQPPRDRILIFEDTDGDGRFDKRKIFKERARNLTSILPGFGGVFACSTPELVFIPDRNGDDVPDGEPEVLLTGWNDGGIGHCVFNGLTWGPDGWIYGTQGIQGESTVGKPDGGPRTRFNGGVWRYHPTRKTFEVVAEGTVNPWGLDFDDYGQGFFTNCVIGHLWHLIPGAHYERMYGQDYTPNTYGLIKPCSDHVHYSGAWEASGKGGTEVDKLGGGHAHAGAMLYLGDSWPKPYRNTIFMHNIHGHRLNNDVLERRGSGYVGRHAQDFLRSSDPWFRGLAAKYGPDGSVFVSDWSDVGECHDKTGVHRTSGRIYKIAYGSTKPLGELDIAKLSDKDLVALQLNKNDWYVRHARRVLQERAAAGTNLTSVHQGLRELLQNPDETRRLRAVWALHGTGGLDESAMLALLDDKGEHVRGWAIRLAAEDRSPSDAVIEKWTKMAAKDPSPLVRLFLASALQRTSLERRKEIAAALLRHGEDAEDPNIPLMIWYAIEPLVASDPAIGSRLLGESKINLVRQYIARRIAARR